MSYVDVSDAQANLPGLMSKVEAGEEVIITRAGSPVVRLVCYNEPTQGDRRFGAFKGQLIIDDDLFSKPLSEDELARWES